MGLDADLRGAGLPGRGSCLARGQPSGPEPDGEQAKFEFRRTWQRQLHDAGWAGISWPKEFGGRGATLISR